MGYFDAFLQSAEHGSDTAMNYYNTQQKMRDQKAKDALEQSNWLTENQQKQAQQVFTNQDTVKQRQLADKAQDAANLGDVSAIKFLQAMNQPQDSGEGTMTGPNGKPAQLRPGEISITQGQPQGGGMDIGLSPIPQQTGQPTMTLDRLAASVLKQNPELSKNPQAFFATLDKLKTILPIQDQNNLEKMKFQLEKEKADPEYIKNVAGAKEAGKNMGDTKQVASGAKDVLNTYKLLEEDSKTAPSGAIESGAAKAANYLNIPTEGSVAQGRFEANLNNLFLATVRTLKGTGRVMQSEIQNIAQAAPKPTDSNAVKMAKIKAHMEYYKHRMNDLGYDPETGKPTSDGAKEQAAPAQGNDPLGLFQ